jgi:hypothetical protein
LAIHLAARTNVHLSAACFPNFFKSRSSSVSLSFFERTPATSSIAAANIVERNQAKPMWRNGVRNGLEIAVLAISGACSAISLCLFRGLVAVIPYKTEIISLRAKKPIVRR